MPTTAPTELPELLTEAQAAEVLNVAQGTLNVWRATKRYPTLRYVKVGRHIRYRRDDLMAWIDSRTVGESA